MQKLSKNEMKTIMGGVALPITCTATAVCGTDSSGNKITVSCYSTDSNGQCTGEDGHKAYCSNADGSVSMNLCPTVQ